jgi:hypothetical protein
VTGEEFIPEVFACYHERVRPEVAHAVLRPMLKFSLGLDLLLAALQQVQDQRLDLRSS